MVNKETVQSQVINWRRHDAPCDLFIGFASVYAYTLPAKNMEYFLLQRFFSFLWSVKGFSVLEICSYEQISFLEELIST